MPGTCTKIQKQTYLDIFSRDIYSTIDATLVVIDFFRRGHNGTNHLAYLSLPPDHPYRESIKNDFFERHEHIPPSATCEALALTAAEAFPTSSYRFLRVKDGGHVSVIIDETIFDSSFSVCIPVLYNTFISRSKQTYSGYELRNHDESVPRDVYRQHPTFFAPSKQKPACYFSKRQEPVHGVKARKPHELDVVTLEEVKRGPYELRFHRTWKQYMKQVLLIRTLHESGSRGAYVGVLKTFEVKETLALSSGGSIGAGKFVISIEVFKNADSASAGMSWCYSMSDVREHERAIKIFREHLFPLHPIALAQYESKLRSLFKHLHEINVICG